MPKALTRIQTFAGFYYKAFCSRLKRISVTNVMTSDMIMFSLTRKKYFKKEEELWWAKINQNRIIVKVGGLS